MGWLEGGREGEKRHGKRIIDKVNVCVCLLCV